MIKITITNENQLMLDLRSTSTMVQRAINSAVLKTARTVEKQLEAATAQELDIPKRILAKYRIKSRRQGEGAMVWFGYNPIKATYIAEMPPSGVGYGKAKQNDYGVTVRSYIFRKSFLATMRNGKRGVWERGPKGRTNLFESKVSILRAPEMSRQIMARVQEIHAKNFKSEIEKRLK